MNDELIVKKLQLKSYKNKQKIKEEDKQCPINKNIEENAQEQNMENREKTDAKYYKPIEGDLLLKLHTNEQKIKKEADPCPIDKTIREDAQEQNREKTDEIHYEPIENELLTLNSHTNEQKIKVEGKQCPIYKTTKDNAYQKNKKNRENNSLINSNKVSTTVLTEDNKNWLKTTQTEIVQFTEQCYTCNREFLSKKALRVHNTRMHKKKAFCAHCNQSYPSRAALQTHLLNNHENFPCDVCGIVLKTSNALNEHMFRHTDFQQFNCKLCSYSCNSRFWVKRHVTFKHPHLQLNYYEYILRKEL